jgi:hypothetical protein
MKKNTVKTGSRRNRNDFAVAPTLWSDVEVELNGILEDVGGFRATYLQKEWKRKLLDPSKVSAKTRKDRAIDKWLAVEERNARTNQRLMFAPDEYDRRIAGTTLGRVVTKTQDLIRQILGSVPLWDDNFIFTSGASFHVDSKPGAIARKLLSGRDVTVDAWPHVARLIRHDSILDDPAESFREIFWGGADLWRQLRSWEEPSFVDGNSLFTVDKSSEIDRCAAKEPTLNMLMQRALGNAIRRSLRKVGVDLNDQTRNQRLARTGSISGSLATIDLSSASDSMSVECVRLLLPPEWFAILDDCRSKWTYVRDEWHDNEMFSSMGNGFTFELESLIFVALTRALAWVTGSKGSISVFGDDIICPSDLAHGLGQVLGYFGFSLNSEKSFWGDHYRKDDGFRESCGKHYHRGEDVSPFYVKEIPLDAKRYIHLGNKLRQWLAIESDVLDPRFYALWCKIRNAVPRPVWGGYDYDSIDTLVVPNVRPIASLRSIYATDKRATERLQHGLYLQWHASKTNLPAWSDPRLLPGQHPLAGLDLEGPNTAEPEKPIGLKLRRESKQRWYAFYTAVAMFYEEYS